MSIKLNFPPEIQDVMNEDAKLVLLNPLSKHNFILRFKTMYQLYEFYEEKQGVIKWRQTEPVHPSYYKWLNNCKGMQQQLMLHALQTENKEIHFIDQYIDERFDGERRYYMLSYIVDPARPEDPSWLSVSSFKITEAPEELTRTQE